MAYFLGGIVLLMSGLGGWIRRVRVLIAHRHVNVSVNRAATKRSGRGTISLSPGCSMRDIPDASLVGAQMEVPWGLHVTCHRFSCDASSGAMLG